jgi:hypothetical protein
MGMDADRFQLVFGGVVPAPAGAEGFGFMLVAQAPEPPTDGPDEALEITAPRLFATEADAEAMGRKAIAYAIRTGVMPDLSGEAFYVDPEPPDGGTGGGSDT